MIRLAVCFRSSSVCIGSSLVTVLGSCTPRCGTDNRRLEDPPEGLGRALVALKRRACWGTTGGPVAVPPGEALPSPKGESDEPTEDQRDGRETSRCHGPAERRGTPAGGCSATSTSSSCHRSPKPPCSTGVGGFGSQFTPSAPRAFGQQLPSPARAVYSRKEDYSSGRTASRMVLAVCWMRSRERVRVSLSPR